MQCAEQGTTPEIDADGGPSGGIARGYPKSCILALRFRTGEQLAVCVSTTCAEQRWKIPIEEFLKED
jgi:hypothetical protein